MKAVELEKTFNPRNFEDRIYKLWKEAGAFKPEKARDKDKIPYVITIPPPNVTGILHLGHGLVISIIDIIIRYHRMKGGPVLWVPGTDHAGIATQHVVEKKLLSKGEDKNKLGREKFLEETWKVKDEHHRIITAQMARMGASVDWDRERFTMDEGLSRAVREVFVSLYEKKLIYKGNYLVNWCTSCGTALSDDEVEHEEIRGKMYHINYPLADGSGFLEIATTRPETMLGDTAVAVHPADKRYTHLHGKKIILPLTGREIPVVADNFVDMDFGTGAVKITPAHDPNDRDTAIRCNLPEINILTPDGHLNDKVPEKYRGLNVLEAREKIIGDLKELGLYIKDEDISHSVGCCYRCNTVIEPLLSEQWFVKMKPLAEKALAAWRNDEIIFYPKKWENTYQHWLLNIRDWCISRRLWWGHRIPAWYCGDCGKTSVSREDLFSCPNCSSKNISQDPDVLDTWFSSWLWPFSVSGWENSGCQKEDFFKYYPTTALVTAYDIIFFWVSRMIMAGLEFTNKVPFRDIYIHQLIRDKQGRKMSKSLGNGIDPLEIVDEYGADALKFTLAYLCAQGQDILMDKESFKLGSRFANKIWNAARYILMNLENRSIKEAPVFIPLDRWIYSKLNTTSRLMEEAFLSYRFNDAAKTIYDFFWNDFCDWYVEATKLSLKNGDEEEKDRAASVLLLVLENCLKLLHPLLPFVTEEIYSKLPDRKAGELLISSSFPVFDESLCSTKTEEDFEFLQNMVRQIRTLRSECTIPPEKKIRVSFFTPGREIFVRDNTALFRLLAGISELDCSSSEIPKESRAGSIGLAGNGYEIFVFISDAVDMTALKQKFSKELEKDRKYIDSLKSKLANENFIKNAPAELITAEKSKLEECLVRTGNLESYIRDMA